MSTSKDLDTPAMSAEDRKEAEESGKIIHAFAMKGLLHKLDPKAFPLSDDAASPEAKVAQIVKAIKAKPFAKLRPLIEKNRDQVGEFSRIIKSVRGLNLDAVSQREEAADSPASDTTPVSARSRLHLVIRSLHCVDETNPENGEDDMILGAATVGASGNTGVAKTIIRSGFDDGERVVFGVGGSGRQFARYSLNSTSSYPKNFYAVLKLIESDGDDEDVAAGLELVLFMYSQIAEARYKNRPLITRSYNVANAIWYSLLNLYTGDGFRPRIVSVSMNNQNHFGGLESGNLRTGNINGNGGTYRIGYKWRLS